MLRDLINQHNTYLNRNNAQDSKTRPNRKEVSSQSLRMAAQMSEMIPKIKQTISSQIQWKEEKAKLLQELSGSAQRSQHSLRTNLSDTKYDFHRAKSQLKTSTCHNSHKKSMKGEQEWGINGIINGFFQKKDPRQTQIDPINLNLQKHVSTIYALFETQSHTDKNIKVQNQVNQIRTKINKVLFQDLKNNLIHERQSVPQRNFSPHQVSTGTHDLLLKQNKEGGVFKTPTENVQYDKKQLKDQQIIFPPGRPNQLESKNTQQEINDYPTNLNLISFQNLKDYIDIGSDDFNFEIQYCESIQQEPNSKRDAFQQLQTEQFKSFASDEETPENIIDLIQLSFDQLSQKQECENTIKEDIQEVDQLQHLLKTQQKQLSTPYLVTTDMYPIIPGFKIISSYNPLSACKTLARKLTAIVKISLLKSFFSINQFGIEKDQLQQKNRSIKGIVAFIRTKVQFRYTQVFSILCNIKFVNQSDPKDTTYDMSTSFNHSNNSFESIHQKFEIQDIEEQIQQFENKQTIPRSKSQESQNYSSKFEKIVKKSQKIQNLPIQISSLHQYIISKDEPTPVKNQIFQENIYQGQNHSNDKMDCKPSFGRKKSPSGQMIVYSPIQSNNQFSRNNDLKNTQQSKQVQPLLRNNFHYNQLGIEGLPFQNYKGVCHQISQSNKKASLSNHHVEVKVNIGHHRRRGSQQSENLSPTKGAIRQEPFDHLNAYKTVQNVASGKVSSIQKQFHNFFQSKNQKTQQTATPTKHKSTKSQKCVPLQSERGKNLSNNQNLLNQEEVQYSHQMLKHDTNNQLTNHIFMQKARIAKKFQLINKQNSGSCKQESGSSKQESSQFKYRSQFIDNHMSKKQILVFFYNQNKDR